MRQQPDGTWKQTGHHQGIDIFTERGAPIVAMSAGTVENIGWTFYSGLRVGIRGDDGAYYFYAHLSDVAQGLAGGQRVRAAQLLGRVGSSGYGPVGTADEFPAHLHFGVQTRRGWINQHETLQGLFAISLKFIDGQRAELAAIQARIHALSGRAMLPDAPPAAALQAAKESANKAREARFSAATISI